MEVHGSLPPAPLTPPPPIVCIQPDVTVLRFACITCMLSTSRVLCCFFFLPFFFLQWWAGCCLLLELLFCFVFIVLFVSVSFFCFFLSCLFV